MLDDIALFVHIVRRGGLTEAARQLSLPPATVTRRLQRLERQVGARLLHRSARRCVPTQEGEEYFRAYADLVDQFDQTRRQLSRDLGALEGRLRVLAPSNLSQGFLRPMWLGFSRRYPKIQLELHVSNELQDMVRSRADIALRIGPQADSPLYQQRLGRIETLVVASPGFLAECGEPAQPSDIKAYRVIGSTLRTGWKLWHTATGQTAELFPRFGALFNDTSLVKYMACDGQGLALLPMTEVKPALASGELVRVLPEWRGEHRDMYAVWPGGRLLNARARCLRDYMQSFIEAQL